MGLRIGGRQKKETGHQASIVDQPLSDCSRRTVPSLESCLSPHCPTNSFFPSSPKKPCCSPNPRRTSWEIRLLQMNWLSYHQPRLGQVGPSSSKSGIPRRRAHVKKGTEGGDRVMPEADLGVMGVQRKGTEDSRAGAEARKRQQRILPGVGETCDLQNCETIHFYGGDASLWQPQETNTDSDSKRNKANTPLRVSFCFRCLRFRLPEPRLREVSLFLLREPGVLHRIPLRYLSRSGILSPPSPPRGSGILTNPSHAIEVGKRASSHWLLCSKSPSDASPWRGL